MVVAIVVKVEIVELTVANGQPAVDSGDLICTYVFVITFPTPIQMRKARLDVRPKNPP